MKRDHEILENLERCFGDGEVKSLTLRSSDYGGPFGTEPIKVVHAATSAEFIGAGGSQVRNKISALLQLLTTEFVEKSVT